MTDSDDDDVDDVDASRLSSARYKARPPAQAYGGGKFATQPSVTRSLRLIAGKKGLQPTERKQQVGRSA